MIKLIDLINEEKMTPAQKKKRGKIFDKLVDDGMPKEKAGPIATSRAMEEKKGIDRDNDGDVDSEDWKIGRNIAIKKAKSKKAKSKKINEGDHEVSMAVSSLEEIAKAIIELRQKLGNQERNIPGWIQDHIAKAENYIEQAAQGFHELKHDELDEAAKVRREPIGGRMIELIISSKDKAEVEKEIEKIEREYPSAGYGTTVKKSPYQKGDTWIAVVSRSTTSD